MSSDCSDQPIGPDLTNFEKAQVLPYRPEQALGPLKKAVYFLFFPSLTTLVATIPS
jgi:hypothetical protein